MPSPVANFIKFILGIFNTIGVLIAAIWLAVQGHWLFVLCGFFISYACYRAFPSTIMRLVTTPASLVTLYRDRQSRALKLAIICRYLLACILITIWESLALYFSIQMTFFSVNRVLVLIYVFGIISSPFSSTVLKLSEAKGPVWARLMIIQIALQVGLLFVIVLSGIFKFGVVAAEISALCLSTLGVLLASGMVREELEMTNWFEGHENTKIETTPGE